MQTISHDVGSFSKASSFQSAHMQKVSQNLEQLLTQLSSLAATKEHDLPTTIPQYKFKFSLSGVPNNWETKNTSTTISANVQMITGNN